MWSKIKQEETTLHEILFYSQGPIDGYLLGEDVRDLLMKSCLPLTVLSKIWTLADVSNDNVLNVHEFVLIMHLIRGVMGGRPVPETLPRSLTPSDASQQTPSPMTQQERDAYLHVFQALDANGAGYIDGDTAADVFLASKLSTEILAMIWDLSDFGRDGQLSPEEFAIACHLLRYAKRGGSFNGPIDIFTYAPHRVSPVSLFGRKQRVLEREERKQRLISLKEKRMRQASREARRLGLIKEKLEYLQEIFALSKRLGMKGGTEQLQSEEIRNTKMDVEKQEEIVIRLKKIHEEVRQETVKIIIGEQKFNADISRIKQDTDELNRRLLSIHTHENREENPFQQLIKQGKEDVTNVDVYVPFKFSPFDLTVTPDSLQSSLKILEKRNNNKPPVGDLKSVLADLKEFGEEFMDIWGVAASASKNRLPEMEEDETFMEVHDMNDVTWPGCGWPNQSLPDLTDTPVAKLTHKLSDLDEQLKRLNSEGGRLVFRNSEDYWVRKKAIENENKADENRFQRKSVTDRLRNRSTDSSKMRDTTNRFSYSGERKGGSGKDNVSSTTREFVFKRQSLDLDSSSVPRETLKNSEKKLKRSTTDPVSFIEQTSIYIDGSVSSLDQADLHPMSSENIQERSSNIKNQLSLRTDESSILTLRSSRRMDSLSLDLASIALGRTIQVESVPTPVSSQRAEQRELEGKVRQQGGTRTHSLTPISLETDQQKKKQSAHSTHADNSRENIAGFSNSPTKCSDEHRAVSLSSTTSLHDLHQDHLNPHHDTQLDTYHDSQYDQINKHSSSSGNSHGPAKSAFPPTLLNENLLIKGNVSSHVLSVGASANPHIIPTLSHEISDNKPASQFDVRGFPQRPPRLKKQNTISETCKPPLSSTSHGNSLDPPVPTRELQSIRANVTNEHLIGIHLFESALQNNENDHKATPLAKQRNVTIRKQDNFLGQASAEPNEIQRAVSTYDQNSAVDKRTHVILKQESQNKQIESEVNQIVNEPKLNKDHKIDGQTEDKFTERRSGVPPEIGLRVVGAQANLVAVDSLNIISNFPQLQADSSINSITDCHEDENPPPLPISPAPVLPTGSPPLPKSLQLKNASRVFQEPAEPSRVSKPSSVFPTENCKDSSTHKNLPSPRTSSVAKPNYIVASSPNSRKVFVDHCSTQPSVSASLSEETNPHTRTGSGFTLDKSVSDNARSNHIGPSDNVFFTDSKSKPQISEEIPKKTRRLSAEIQPRHTNVTKTDTQVGTWVVSPDNDVTFEGRPYSAEVQLKNFVESSLPDNMYKVPGELVQVNGKSVKGSNTGEYGFVYSAERSVPLPEVGWTDKQDDDHKINLYSENVLKEGDTTEAVDRESIASLSATKKQWEVIFTSHNISQVETAVKKKTIPKWEVKVPYTEKHIISTNQDSQNSEDSVRETNYKDNEDSAMFKKHIDTEGAIDREIRLAHERDDVLRKEKEARLKQMEKQIGQGPAIIASYEAESESFHHVYNELAEADRGPDLWSVEHRRRNQNGDDDSDDNTDDTNPNESIIEREIRVQKEREAEVARMRKHANTSTQQLQQNLQEQHQPTPTVHVTKQQTKNVNKYQTKDVSSEDPVAKRSHEGANLIARELRELKEREDELKRTRSSTIGIHITDEVDGSTQISTHSQKINAFPGNSQRSSQVEPPSGQGIWNRDLLPVASQQRRESLESTSSQGSARTPSDSILSGRDVRVRPIADSLNDDEDQKPDYFKKQETPIEREMRLVRERENELRRQKGLPDVENKDDSPYSSYGSKQTPNNSTSVSRPISVAHPSESMQKFATSRLQQEMQKQQEIEHELRSQGKVISKSEDHIGLKKYLEIAGVDKVDGTEKRNFITKKTSVSHSESDPSFRQLDVTSSGGRKKASAAAAGGNMFSYKEFKQTAESKIEKELRELREREEELRLQRKGGQVTTNQ